MNYLSSMMLYRYLNRAVTSQYQSDINGMQRLVRKWFYNFGYKHTCELSTQNKL